MADEPDWAKVLRFMYNNEGTYTVVADSKNGEELGGEDHYNEMKRKMLFKLNLQANEINEVKEVIDHLERLNLINLGKRSDDAELKLEPDGFEVAHERELTKQQNRTNHTLAILTAGLVFAALVQALAAILTLPQKSKIWMIIGTGIFGFLIILGLYRTASVEPTL